MTIHRMLLAFALVASTACATPETDDPEATAADLADLPDVVDGSHADLVEVDVPNDAATFDTTDVTAPVDDPYDDSDTLAIAKTLPLLKWGLAPRASNALRAAGITSGRIMQTIGNASASAGTHLQDGVVNGDAYCAATDISVSGLSQTQIANLLERLAKVGFAAWYRHTGHDHWSGVNHIHAVYANLKMKSSLRSQVWSWLDNRNGLVGNAIYTFHHWTAAARAFVSHRFAQSAHGTTNGGSDVSSAVCTAAVTKSRVTRTTCIGVQAPDLRHSSTRARMAAA